MKTAIINRNSWHFRLQAFVFQLSDPYDFCNYVRRVIWSVAVMSLLCIASIVFSVVVLYSAGDFIGWLAAGVFYGFVPIEDGKGFAAVLLLMSVVALCLAIKAGAPIIGEHRPDFIADAYRSLKDHVCYRLEIRG